MAQPALELQGIAKLYGHTVALRATSLRVATGETLALLGPNGSGKTTLLKIIAGAIAPTIGSGSIFGHDMVKDRVGLRRSVGLLAAETYHYDDLTARENLVFYAVMQGAECDDASLTSILRHVGLTAYADTRVRAYSSGMKRRLSLARLILQKPRLLLLDEPYNSMDAAGSDLVDETVRVSTRSGCSTILATHDAHRALSVAQCVAVLDGGRVEYMGPVMAYRQRHRVG
ncbi:MAG: ABC transporter ATP-binding protein [Chloroflexota bacterium]